MDSDRLLEALYRRVARARDADVPALSVLRARLLLNHFPTFGPVWCMLGDALTSLGRHEEAEQALANAIEHWEGANLRLPYTAMGHLFEVAGDGDKAAEWYRRAIGEAPSHASPYIHLGLLLHGRGRLGEAEATFRTATRCSEGRVDEAYLNLGLALRSREKFEEAA